MSGRTSRSEWHAETTKDEKTHTSHKIIRRKTTISEATAARRATTAATKQQTFQITNTTLATCVS